MVSYPECDKKRYKIGANIIKFQIPELELWGLIECMVAELIPLMNVSMPAHKLVLSG